MTMNFFTEAGREVHHGQGIRRKIRAGLSELGVESLGQIAKNDLQPVSLVLVFVFGGEEGVAERFLPRNLDVKHRHRVVRLIPEGELLESEVLESDGRPLEKSLLEVVPDFIVVLKHFLKGGSGETGRQPALDGLLVELVLRFQCELVASCRVAAFSQTMELLPRPVQHDPHLQLLLLRTIKPQPESSCDRTC